MRGKFSKMLPFLKITARKVFWEIPSKIFSQPLSNLKKNCVEGYERKNLYIPTILKTRALKGYREAVVAETWKEAIS